MLLDPATAAALARIDGRELPRSPYSLLTAPPAPPPAEPSEPPEREPEPKQVQHEQ